MASTSMMLFICITIPLLMMLVILKGKSRYIVAFFIVGMYLCTLSGGLNTMVVNYIGCSRDYAVTNLTPVIEELLKAIPVVFIAIIIGAKKQTVLECSLATGVGFATLENAYILYTNSNNITISYILIRAFGAGLMHAVCGVAVGYIMCIVASKRNLIYTCSLAMLSLTMIFHSVFNILITSEYMILGAVLPIIAFIPIIATIAKQKNKLKS